MAGKIFGPKSFFDAKYFFDQQNNKKKCIIKSLTKNISLPKFFFYQMKFFNPKNFSVFLTRTNLTKKSFEQVQGTNRCVCKKFKSLQVLKVLKSFLKVCVKVWKSLKKCAKFEKV